MFNPLTFPCAYRLCMLGSSEQDPHKTKDLELPRFCLQWSNSHLDLAENLSCIPLKVI